MVQTFLTLIPLGLCFLSCLLCIIINSSYSSELHSPLLNSSTTHSCGTLLPSWRQYNKSKRLSGTKSINHWSSITDTMLHFLVVFISFPVAMVKHSGKATSGFILAQSSRNSSLRQGSKGNSSVKQVLRVVNKEHWMYTFSFFLSFIQFRIPAHGMVLATLKTPLPTSIDFIKVIPQRHAQIPFSQAILDTVKLTSNINHHTNP